jgi:Secretion system C-terminal sorting domain
MEEKFFSSIIYTFFKKLIMKLNLKGVLVGAFFAASLSSFAQPRAVTLDPKLGLIKITDLSGNQINENYLQPGQMVKLVIPVASVSQTDILPKGSCKIKIGLGSKLQIDPSYDLATVNGSNYFTWNVLSGGGQSQIIGDLTTSLPANFQQVEVAFKVLGNQAGHSTITANFLITNHNTGTVLSDNNGDNNTAFLAYNITNAAAPTPITTINELVKTECSLKVNFSTDRELNLNNYQLEASKNGVDFVKIYQTNATSLASYNTTIAIPKELQSPVVYIRVKSTFNDGRIAYSAEKSVSALCDGKWLIDMYPNPTRGNEDVVIRAAEGVFDGKYTITLYDMAGRIVDVKQMEFNNVLNFKYKIANWAAGKYSIKMVSIKTAQTALLQFEKL